MTTKQNSLIIVLTLALTAMTASATEHRVYDHYSSSTPETEFTLASVYHDPSRCLAMSRVSGYEYINNKKSDFGRDNKITVLSFENGKRWIFDKKTTSLSDDNNLRNAGLIKDNLISYSSQSTDIVFLEQTEYATIIKKTWKYYDTKGRERFGESYNYAISVDCESIVTEFQDKINSHK